MVQRNIGKILSYLMKTGELIRRIHFRNSTAFDKFIIDFKAMRFPGYGWRYRDKGKK